MPKTEGNLQQQISHLDTENFYIICSSSNLLITSQFCEGGVHFIGQRLVPVLIDSKFI